MLKQVQYDLLIPGVAFLVAIGAQYSGLDVWLVRPFYAPITASWPYRSAWLTETLLHRGGRALIAALAITLLVLLFTSLVRPGLRSYRIDLVYVLVAAIVGPLIVGVFKSTTHIYSPWDLQLFGGLQPYVHLFDRVAPGAPVGHAFPSGHASGGFAFLGLFFALRRRAIRTAWLSLFLPILLGLVFGIAQQARGAHFFSHDLMAFAVCWLSAALLARLFYLHERVPVFVKNNRIYPTPIYQKEYS